MRFVKLPPRQPTPSWPGRAVWMALAALTPAACEAPDSAADVAGIDVSALPTVTAEQVVVLGGADAPEEQAFSRVPPLELLPDGSILLLAGNEVRRFGGDGTYQGSIGGEGQGPGEFVNAFRFGFVADTVWVRNLSPPLLSRFTLEGDHIRTDRDEDPVVGRSGIIEGPEALLRGGTAFVDGVVPWGGPDGRTEIPLMVTHPDGRRDTLAMAVDPPGISVPGRGWFSGRLVAHPSPPLYDVVPGGEAVIVASWNPVSPDQGLVLRRVDPDGRTTREDTLRLAPVPLASSVADSIVRAVADSIRVAGARQDSSLQEARNRGAAIPDVPALPSNLEDVVREQLALAATHPPVRGVLAGADGTVWLDCILGPGRSLWVVLDEAWDPIFTVELPAESTLRAATRTSAWVTHMNALDVPFVVHYELSPEGDVE